MRFEIGDELEFYVSEELTRVSRRLSVREIAVSRASGARKLNYWESFLFFWE
jgi:hypothetical protein